MVVCVADIKQMRENANISQVELAKMVGVSQAYIARIEGGSLDPKLSIVQSIVRYLGGTRDTICSDIMTTEVESIDARDLVILAARRMTTCNYSQLPVLRGTRLIGCITKSDIVANIHLNLEEMTVEAIMSPDSIPIVNENTPVAKIIPLLQDYPAVIIQGKKGRMTGILSRTDLLKRFRDGVMIL